MFWLSRALVEKAAACTCEPASASSTVSEVVSMTVTSTRPAFSSASWTLKSSGNCVKPLPHSTPPRSALATVRTFTLVERLAVLDLRTYPKTSCVPTISTKKPTTKMAAAFAMVLPTLEPEGSSAESGSMSTPVPVR